MQRKATTLILVGLMALLLVIGVSAQEDDMMEGTEFTVTIENIAGIGLFENSGIFNTPDMAEEPGPVLPGSAYTFTVTAEPGENLHFTTMYVQSNDLFFAPDASGIALYDDSGAAISGDVTDQVDLWDAGTEVNEPLGEGENQAPRQAGPDTGDDENAVVSLVEDFNVAEYITVTVEAGDNGEFTMTIANISENAMTPSPLSPGLWVVTDEAAPLFHEGHFDRGQGLEEIAEDGNPTKLATVFAGIESAIVGPIAPGPYVIHTETAPLFTTGEPSSSELEAVAEDGNASGYAELEGFGIFNTPDMAEEPGPALPGSAYTFTITAVPGDYLNFATMLVQSNDLFFAPDENGIPLFDDMDTPINGDVTRYILLWDAGTEVNEEPGVGENQAPRQPGPDTGDDEMGVVLPISEVMDGFEYPPVAALIRVTISSGDMMGDDEME